MRQGRAPTLTTAHTAKVHREVPERVVPSTRRKMDGVDLAGHAGAGSGGAYLMQQDAPVERMIRLLQRETMYHEDMAWQS